MPTSKKLMLPALLLTSSLMMGCATNTFAIDSACKSFRIIRASTADTPKTKRQVIGHNRAYDAICKG